MPTYEYACDSCGNHFDAVQKMTDAPLTACPECGGGVHRLLSGGMGIAFKGSGFYANDSRTGGAKKTETAPASSSCACAGCPNAKAST